MSLVEYRKCDACGDRIDGPFLNVKLKGACFVEEYTPHASYVDVYRKLEDQDLDICKECTRHFKSFMKAIDHD